MKIFHDFGKEWVTREAHSSSFKEKDAELMEQSKKSAQKCKTQGYLQGYLGLEEEPEQLWGSGFGGMK